MGTTRVMEEVSTNTTSEVHIHHTHHEFVWVQITGTMDTATVTPYVSITGDRADMVALDGVAWTATDVNRVSLGINHLIEVRTTSVGGSSSITVDINSPDTN